MGFDATAVDAMSYDFTTWADDLPEGAPVTGNIPEPSVRQIDAFNDFWIGQLSAKYRGELRELQAEREQLLAVPADQRDQAATQALEDRIILLRRSVTTAKLLDPQMDAIAALCSGSPSAEALHALPGRVQTAFRDYVMGEVIDGPKEKTGSNG